MRGVEETDDLINDCKGKRVRNLTAKPSPGAAFS